MPTLFICSILLFSTAFSAFTQPDSSYKALVAEQVYQQIAEAVQDSRKAPRFSFIFSKEVPYYNAYYNPKDNSINLGEGIYDLTLEFGTDSLNALALVLGHELAHYYKDHDWGMAFGTANTDTEIADAIYELELSSQQRTKLEAEADYFGALFGYLAGYNTLDVGPLFYQKLYERLELGEDIEGYPSMQDRIQICENSRKRLQDLLPLLDAAQMAVLTEQYSSAAAYFDQILHEFPSRGIYYNAGMALVYEALRFYQPIELRFLYPFAWDAESRLRNVGRRAAGTNDKRKRRTELLQEAKDYLEKALQLDEAYTPALLQLGLVYQLLGESDFALAYVGKAQRSATEGSRLAAFAEMGKGILWAEQELNEQAEQAFQAAAQQLPEMAARNLKVLSGAIEQAWTGSSNEAKAPYFEEYIAEAQVSDFSVLLELYDPVVQELPGKNDRPSMYLFHFSDTESGFRLLAWEERDAQNYPIGQRAFLMTLPNYQGHTAGGIQLGSSQEELREIYGEPLRIYAGLQKDFWFYATTPIIFEIDADGKVLGWRLYLP